MEWTTNARKEIVFFVNGSKVVEKCPDPEMTLLYYLRNKLGLPGTKLGCGEGGCGACTVMVSQYQPQDKTIRHHSVNACVAPLCSLDGMAVTTVEGIGGVAKGLHPVQERMAAAHGSQCGFCTPGIVMSMYTLLRNNPHPSQAEMERAFDGNLCRCTGYRAILDGYKTFTKEFCCGGKPGGKCCKNEATGTIEGPFALFDPSKFKPLDPTQEPIFPPELQVASPPDPIFVRGPLSSWHHGDKEQQYQTVWARPVTLQQLLETKERHPDGKVTVGSTEISVEMAVRGLEYLVFINPSRVLELTALEVTEAGLLVGAACPLSEVGRRMQELVDQLPEYKTQAFTAVLEMLRWFAGDQIRNVASIGGNLVTASPISDLSPILMAVGATAHIASRKGGHRSAVIDDKFFVSYRKVDMEPSEVLISVLIPFVQENEHVVAFKQARRREDDIAVVNACFKVALGKGGVVQSCSLIYGGRAPVTKRAALTEQAIVGQTWDSDLLEQAMGAIPRDFPVDSDVPGGMPEYRQTLTMSLFYKFYTVVRGRLAKESVPPSEANITTPFQHTPTQSSQGFQSVPQGQLVDDAVGRPLPHLSATMQASGEATYVDDMPSLSNELYAGVVLSTRAHAKLLAVDASEAAAIPGVWGFVSARDVGEGESNRFRVAAAMDEPVFAEDEVLCRGQLIGLVLASDKMLAQRAARRVRVSYQELPSILTIQEAIAADSFYEPEFAVTKGSVEEGFESADHIVSGEVHVGGQEHFYLETQASIVVPKEGGEMEIFTSTQNAHMTQIAVAMVTGVPANRIAVRVKRIGGGFGGKETRSVPTTVAVALAAKKCGRPVRLMLDRHEDMVSTGTRHPFLARYKVGCTKEGILKAAQLELFSNSGFTLDLSIGVLHRAMWHVDNAYFIPHWRVVGRNCRTNVPSNTAFRGFGGPQGMLVAENFIGKVAKVCGLDPTDVRRRNLYQEGDSTHYGQPLVDCHIRQCWEELAHKVDFAHRRTQVDNFNKSSRWIKRGMAVIPTKFGIAFGIRPLNQGGALVHVYSDGSVLVSHGGVEMGQGLHTKMSQVAARALGVPVERVYIGEMATTSVANASPTAASFSADLYGMAIKDACEQIKSRLSPYMEANLKGRWEDWVSAAHQDLVNLSANGFSNFPEFNFDWSVGQGTVFKYFSYGVACSEVEVDTLTGDHHVVRTDIVMDVGESLNPAIDIGQIEGGFTQGQGMFTLEEHVVLDGDERTRGTMVTNGPGAYKIPGFSDIPREFNVSLLKGVPNKRAIYSSKAIGEPPLFLASSVFFAIKDAIAASRRDCGATTDFPLDSPATVERIRMACADNIAEAARKTVRDNGKRWNV